MAAGKFVVATNVGGVADLVEPGRTGLLVPPRDAAALAAAMQVAMTYSESERQHMGALGRSKVMAIHGEERVCDNWDDLLAQAAGERTRSMRSNG
jgi:glycosyltransferase involved in cell wall biosynthesis